MGLNVVNGNAMREQWKIAGARAYRYKPSGVYSTWSFLLLFPRIISLPHLLLGNISFLRTTRPIVCLMNRLAVEYNAIQKLHISFRLDYYCSVNFCVGSFYHQDSIENVCDWKVDIFLIKPQIKIPSE